MMIPAGLNYILNTKLIENERVEFKRSWNPEPIMHTICAYANDISNLSGGFIVIGMNDDGTIEGVDKKDADRMNHDTINLCSTIEPRCNAFTEYIEKEGKGLFVIWVPGGHERPYRCPTNINKKTEKAYYIRRIASTVKANNSETKELIETSANTPFDDRVNHNAEVTDIDLYLVKNFLSRINSSLSSSFGEMKREELMERLNLVRTMDNQTKPLNVALMFFSEHPDDYFRCAYIDIVNKPNPTGTDMTERRITGPLDRQIIDSVSVLKNQFIEEKIIKLNDRPEAIRVFNYPLEAVEEAITNAVYHKDYNTPEPITITILPDRMEITSVPGPFRSISDADLKSCRLISKTSRNRRIGEFLKELKLAEGRNTGIPTMIGSLIDNQSEKPRFETDGERTYMNVVLKINPQFLKEKIIPIKGRLTNEQKRLKIIDILSNGEYSTKEISNRLGYDTIMPALKKLIYEMIADGTIEYTENKLRSSKQKLRLRK